MIEGKKREALTKTGQTKDTHPGIARRAAKMIGRFKGVNNPSNNGLWITPHGKFETCADASISIGSQYARTVSKICRENTKLTKKLINNTTLSKDLIGVLSYDAGFGFEPKAVVA